MDAFVIKSLKTHLGADIFQRLGPQYEHLLAGLSVLVIFWLFLWWLYRQKIFIRI
jgi:hypothetical protein